MFPAQYLFADTGRSVHGNEKIVWKNYNFYSMNSYKQYIYLRIMYTIKRILLYLLTEDKYIYIILRNYFYKILIPILLP